MMSEPQIYIIDDNEAVCDSLKFLLETYYPITVQTYQHPLSFLEIFSQDWRGCLIADLFMPGINGIDLTKKIKTINQSIHVIIMSGHGTSQAAAQAMEAGADLFITKPFKTEHLLAKVAAFLK